MIFQSTDLDSTFLRELQKKKTFYCYVEYIKENHDLTDSVVVINIARERKPVSPVIPYYVKSPLNGYGEYLRRKYDIIMIRF